MPGFGTHDLIMDSVGPKGTRSMGPERGRKARRSVRYHFSGIAGAGMNPLARLMRAWGHDVQGSDRSFDLGKNQEVAARLREIGVRLAPQDGRAIGPGIDRFVYSAAVGPDTPEFQAARALGIETVARPALLAEVVNAGMLP